MKFAGRKWVERELSEELACRQSTHVFFTIPGVVFHSVEDDPLHDIFNHCVLGHLIGSFLNSIIYCEGKGTQKVPPAHRLAVIWQTLKENCKDRKIKREVSTLVMSQIHTADKPHAGHPFFKLKGNRTKKLLPAVCRLCETAHDGSELSLHRLEAMKAMTDFVELLDVAPIVPTDSQALEATTLMDTFLEHSTWLCEWAKRGDRLLYHMVNKHHYCWRCPESSNI